MSERTNEEIFEAVFRKRAEEGQRRAEEQSEQRLAAARSSVAQNPQVPEIYVEAGRTLKKMGRLYEALDLLRQGIERCAPSAPLYEYYIERLEKCNRTEEAIAVCGKAKLLFPDELIFTLREALILPVLYDSHEHVELARKRFTEGLHRIVSEVPLDTPLERRRALEAIGRNSNKYLPYQGENDRELQTVYGAWVQRIMQANFPQWAQPNAMPPVVGKIRVGYLSAVSDRFLNLSAARFFGAWITELDRRYFEVFAYHGDNHADPTSECVRRWNTDFRQLSGDVAQIAAAIREDNLHVLVYLDLGMHPRMTQLAALRLAPLQCAAWDAPLTSGIPAMNYFLSSDLMEPEDTSDHYSEELVRLPGVGVCFTKPVIPTVILTKKRSDFGLRDEAVVYLSCQSIFKYLPDQDEMVVQIAKRVPNSQFVFLTTNEVVRKDLQRRVKRAFERAGIDADAHCLFLPEMNLMDYWNLHRLGDVSLDTLKWSGGLSTFDVLACGLPIVTLPGKMMRSRQTFAILTQLGVTETIALDREEYVDIAARLGADREWRETVTKIVMDSYAKLYYDFRGVRAVEDFYKRSVGNHVSAKAETRRGKESAS